MKLADIKKIYVKKDKMHNFNHILRIKRKIIILKRPYKNINLDLLNFLILFHGLKDYVKKNKNKFRKEYVSSLLRHSRTPKKLEEKLIFDANMLDNTGRAGIKKAMNYGKALGRSEKETMKYIKNNLHKVRFYTIEGRKIGRKRIEIMKKFVLKTKSSIFPSASP